MKLVIGNKNYSSWSLRPWLLLSAFNVPFEEIQESLAPDGLPQRFARYSPTRRVPVLMDGDLAVWDSLAICEYVSEQYLDGRGWPAEMSQRARARSVCAEIHAGLSGLRSALPMNCRAHRHVDLSAAAAADVARVDAMWSDCLAASSGKGPWLFGEFSIADCFYAPVALRFLTYDVEISEAAQAYVSQLLGHPSVRRWLADAQRETEVIDNDEAGTPV
ncbi:glutathione S-transferase family protein [Marinobacter caseinilyticus]|uniref:glutathione S-transferase family protein n=1 Tax=Marinobacter caseinilyticus TaxID=2692195 RepID=UPI00140DDBA2|nr:glutathione S-transferase family protein [Marinobacter caseinilyticus]